MYLDYLIAIKLGANGMYAGWIMGLLCQMITRYRTLENNSYKYCMFYTYIHLLSFTFIQRMDYQQNSQPASLYYSKCTYLDTPNRSTLTLIT